MKVEIAERPRFQAWFWGVQRLSWCGLGVVMVISLAGLTGAGGPLSERFSNDTATRVTYPGVMRVNRPEILHIRSDQRELVLNSAFLQVFDIGSIVPVPTRQRSVGGDIGLTFDAVGMMTVVISVTPKTTFAPPLRVRTGAEWHELEITVLP